MKIKYFLALSILTVAVFCVSVPAETHAAGCMLQFSSLSVSDKISCLQQAISDLIAQIAQLLAQLQGQQGGQTWCHTFTNYLTANSTNGEVSYLQTALTKQGFNVSGDTSGIFGDDTAAAVVQFQAKYGIRQTGTVGPLTRAKLNSLYGCGTNPTPTQSSITITSPNGGEIWNVGETHDITWTSTGVSQVEIYWVGYDANGNLLQYIPLSTDGSGNMVSVPASSGKFSWTITGKLITLTPGTKSKIVVDDYSNPKGTNSYSNYFTILNPNGNLPLASLNITSPQSITSSLPGEHWQVGGTYNITWTSANMPSGDTVSIILRSGGNYLQTIASNIPILNGTYSWTIPSSITNYGSYYSILISPAQIPNQGMTGVQNSKNFSITSSANQSSITIASPNGAEQWNQGQTYNITWTTSGYNSVANVGIYLYSDCGPTGSVSNLVGNTTNTGSYSWTIPSSWGASPLTTCVDYKIQLFIKNNGSQNWETNNMSNNYFRIVNPNQGQG